MAALETVLERLRPLVNTKPWDYCVIWRLGDDPSRFIEWGACCCSGGQRPEDIKVKDENFILGTCLAGECRDKLTKHLVRSTACEMLAQLPSAIPLYSGIHGDVVISKQPRWTFTSSYPSDDDDDDDDEPNGTQVLIPVACGLIELFSTEHVPEDQNIIDYVSAIVELSPKQENTNRKANVDIRLKEQLSDPSSDDYLESCRIPLNFVPQMSQPNNYSSFEGSSTCSSLSNEHQLLKIGPGHVLPEKSNKEYVDSTRSNLRLKRKKYTTDCDLMLEKDNAGVKIRHKTEKGVYKSKNLVTERNRRKRIKDGMFALRSLVPKITKMDKASTLGDAAEYIKELEETIDTYQDELKAMEENDYKTYNVKPDQRELIKNLPDKKNGGIVSTPTEVQVEVSQLGRKDFLLKLICKQKRGGFSRLMEALDSYGLRVTDVNVTTLDGSVLNVLRVEANRTEIEPNTLRHSLIELVS